MFKSNCLAKFTVGFFTIQVSLSCIVNVGNLGCLRISTVMYGYINIRIAKFESLTSYFILIRRIAGNAWCDYTVDRLSVIIVPRCLASYIVFSTCFIEGNSLSFIWLSCIAIIIKIMNCTRYSIISSYIFSAMFQVNFISLIYIIVMIKD